MVLAVAPDGCRVVEVVSRVHADSPRQPATQVELALLLEKGDLDAVDLGGVLCDDRDEGVRRDVEVAGAPVAGQGRVEHVA